MSKFLQISWKFLKKLFTSKTNITSIGCGGNGGSPTAYGNNNTLIGGAAGNGGHGANGGNGGAGTHYGDNLFIMGGEAGEAGQQNRGGKGGRSPFEILGAPNVQFPDGTWLWDKSCGGDGDSPSSTNDFPKKQTEHLAHF